MVESGEVIVQGRAEARTRQGRQGEAEIGGARRPHDHQEQVELNEGGEGGGEGGGGEGRGD